MGDGWCLWADFCKSMVGAVGEAFVHLLGELGSFRVKRD